LAREYDFGEEFQRRLLALYIREPQATFGIIEPAYFTNIIYLDIARLVKQIYSKHDKREVRLSKSTLYAIIKGFLGKKRKALWRSYRKIVRSCFKEDLSDRPVILEQAVAFAKEQKFRQALVDAEKDVNSRQFNRAITRFQDLKTFGAERDIGIEFWKDIDTPNRWVEDREGIVGTFYLKLLDRAMAGGLGAGELAIILAGGKVGKSTLLGRIAAGAMWQGKTAAVATGELSAKKYRKRIDAMITRIPSWQLTDYASKSFHKSRYRRKMRKVYRKMALAQRQMRGAIYIKQWPTNKGKVSDIEDWLEQLKEQGVKIDVLIVDYVRVFKPNERSEDQRSRIGQVAMDLRGLATEQNIPVWTASQTNRAALHKDMIGPEDLAEDISQFWTLDFLIALCQTDEEKDYSLNRENEVVRPEHARLFLTAARDVGRSSLIGISLERDTFVVKELPKDAQKKLNQKWRRGRRLKEKSV
jgi:archaellum biogenesis ATPase FlaH